MSLPLLSPIHVSITLPLTSQNPCLPLPCYSPMKPLPSSTPIATSGTPSAMATSRPPTGRRLSTPSPLTAPMPPLPKSPSSDTVYRNDFSGFIAFVVASGFRIQIPTRLAATQPGSATSKVFGKFGNQRFNPNLN